MHFLISTSYAFYILQHLNMGMRSEGKEDDLDQWEPYYVNAVLPAFAFTPSNPRFLPFASFFTV